MTDIAEAARQIETLAARHRDLPGRLAERQSQASPVQDPGFDEIISAFPAWASLGSAWKVLSKAAILQPPRPEIPPSPRILELAADRDRDAEAGG